MSQIVPVPPRQVRWARKHAKARNDFYEKETDWNNERYDPVEKNFVGIIGEIGFAIYYDLQIDATIYEISDGGIDFIMQVCGEECRVDVKTRQNRPDRFWVKENLLKESNANYYVLAYIDRPDDPEALEGWRIELFGGASRDELLDGTRVWSDHEYWNRSLFLEDLEALPDPESVTSG